MDLTGSETDLIGMSIGADFLRADFAALLTVADSTGSTSDSSITATGSANDLTLIAQIFGF